MTPLLYNIIVALVALLITSSCASTKSSIKQFEIAKKAAPYDVVIVPGTPYGDGSLSTILSARIAWAIYLYNNGLTKHIIFSGAAVGTPYYEGAAMKIIADSTGLPPDVSFAEIKAEHSTENAWYGMKLARKLGFKKIALATDPFQSAQLKKFLRKRCHNMSVVPVVFKWLPGGREANFNLHPQIDPASAHVPQFVALAARENFWERFRGTLGKHIVYDE